MAAWFWAPGGSHGLLAALLKLACLSPASAPVSPQTTLCTPPERCSQCEATRDAATFGGCLPVAQSSWHGVGSPSRQNPSLSFQKLLTRAPQPRAPAQTLAVCLHDSPAQLVGTYVPPSTGVQLGLPAPPWAAFHAARVHTFLNLVASV